MSRLKQDDLFRLIKSLNQSEKRYFKIFASRHVLQNPKRNEKNEMMKGAEGKQRDTLHNYYVLLFHAIDRQAEYDENKLVKQMKFRKNLPALKHNLYKIILKSLRVYHAGMSADIHLKSMLHDIAIMYEKGLYEQCEKIIKNAMQLAEKYEKFLAMLELQEWTVKLLKTKSYYKTTKQNVDELFQRTYNIIEQYTNFAEYSHLSSQLFLNYSEKGTSVTGKKMKLPKSMETITGSFSNKKAKSVHALLYYYNLYRFSALYTGNYDELYRYAEKYKNLLEQHPHFINEEPKNYINAIHNLIFCSVYLLKYKEMIPLIDEMRCALTKYKIKSQTLQNYTTASANTFELISYLNTCDFEKGKKLVFATEKYLNDVFWKTLNLREELIWLYTVSTLFIYMGDFNPANRYLNKILNKSSGNVRSDIQCWARILTLIIHFEKNNVDLLGYRKLSAERFLKTQNQLYRFEKIFLNFFGKELLDFNTDKEQRNAFKKLKKEVENIIQNISEKKVMWHFDIISWIESKIQNRPMMEIMKEKAGRYEI